MSIALVQAVNGFWVSTNVVSNTFTSPVTAGHLLIAHVDGSWTYTRQLTITDTLGNAWIPIFVTQDSSSGEQSNVWYTFSKSSGANTVTVYGANNSFNGMALAEFSGVVGIDQITVPRSQNGGSSVPLHTNTSNPVTTLYSEELLISFGCIAGGGYAGGAGGSVIAPMSLLANIGGPDYYAQMGYQIVSSIQTGYTAQMGIANDNADIQLTTFYGGTSLPLVSKPPYQLSNYHVDVIGGTTNPIIEASLMPYTADMYAVFAYAANGQTTHAIPDVSWTDISPSTDGQGVFSRNITTINPVGATVTLGTPNVSASGALALIPTSGTPAIVQSASSATPITGANAGFGWRAVFTSPVSTSNGVIAVLTISDAVYGGVLWANPVDDTNQWYQIGIAPSSGSGFLPTHTASVFIWWCPSPLSGTQTVDVMSFNGPGGGGGFAGTWSIYEVSGLKVPTIPGIVEKIVTAIAPIGSPSGQGTAPISITGTPKQSNEWVIYLGSGQNSNQEVESVPSSFTVFPNGPAFYQGRMAWLDQATPSLVTAVSTIGVHTADWAAMLAMFYTQPTVIQGGNPGGQGGGNVSFSSTTSGNTLILGLTISPSYFSYAPPISIWDSQNNAYQLLGTVANPNSDSFNGFYSNIVCLYVAQNIVGGPLTVNTGYVHNYAGGSGPYYYFPEHPTIVGWVAELTPLLAPLTTNYVVIPTFFQ